VIIDIHVMLFGGFGFLMTFLKYYGISALREGLDPIHLFVFFIKYQVIETHKLI